MPNTIVIIVKAVTLGLAWFPHVLHLFLALRPVHVLVHDGHLAHPGVVARDERVPDVGDDEGRVVEESHDWSVASEARLRCWDETPRMGKRRTRSGGVSSGMKNNKLLWKRNYKKLPKKRLPDFKFHEWAWKWTKIFNCVLTHTHTHNYGLQINCKGWIHNSWGGGGGVAWKLASLPTSIHGQK